MDKNNKKLEVACRHCGHWTNKEYGRDGQHMCKHIEDGEGFSNEGCSGDNIYCTAPDFFCANFTIAKKAI